MAQLPFVVAPRIKPETIEIGNEDIGIIAIERKGYVTTGEKSFVSTHLTEEATTKVLDLCRKISTEYKISLEDAYEKITAILTGRQVDDLAEKIQKKYDDSLKDVFTCMSQEQEKRKNIQAFAMILYRIDSNYEADDFFRLHPDLIEALSNHYEEEESRTLSNSSEIVKEENKEKLSEVEVAEKK